MIGKFDFEENPKSDLDCDLKFVGTAIQLTIDRIFNSIQIPSKGVVPAPVRYTLSYNHIRTKFIKKHWLK